MLPTCIVASHDLYLVGFAACVCLATTWTTACLIPNVQTSRLAWLLASLVLALGTWTTHFVAMLGYEPGLQMTYDPISTAASAAFAIAGVALGIGSWRQAKSRMAAFSAGAAVGLALVAMHYLGMQAVSLPGSLSYDPTWVALSILVGAGLAGVSFAIMRYPPSRYVRTAPATLLLLAIVGLHFIGMAAVSIETGRTEAANGLARFWIAVITGAASLLIAIAFSGVIAIRTMARRRHRTRDAIRLREFAEASFEALAICDAERKIVDANSQFLALCGMRRDQILGLSIDAVFQGGELAPQLDAIGHCTLLNDIPVEVQTRGIGHDFGRRMVVALRDLRQRVLAEQRIHHLAHHDALTGLPNRLVMSKRLLVETARSNRNDSGFAVLAIDLDRFKPINDIYGHAAGDRLLRQVADRLRAELRADDMAARLGGDEFAIIQSSLKRDDPSATLALANRLLERMAEPFDLGETEVTISCSIGVAIYPQDAADADTLLRGADIALYRAKQAGRATFAFFRQEMEETLRDRHLLEQDLRLAAGRGELSLAWQPQATANGVTVGFEALMRWRHPVRGNIPPDMFIPLAEGSGLILQLGAWALQTACLEAARWSNPLRVAVNVSPLQIQQADFLAVVSGILEATGFPPFRLELEVTESLFLSDAERALETLVALKRLGISISLDDFGTGYSSLGTLRKFPFDRIKLDRSFVSKMTDDSQAAAIVHAILGLSRGLGLPVVAEGVETDSQMGALREANCAEIQGYLIGKPQPIEAYHVLIGEPAYVSAAAA